MFKLKAIMILLMVLCISHIGISQEKYAVIITGNEAFSNNVPLTSQWQSPDAVLGEVAPEFWNDTYLMWEMLVYEMDYLDENVFVIFATGEDAQNSKVGERYIAHIQHEDEFQEGDYITDYYASINSV